MPSTQVLSVLRSDSLFFPTECVLVEVVVRMAGEGNPPWTEHQALKVSGGGGRVRGMTVSHLSFLLCLHAAAMVANSTWNLPPLPAGPAVPGSVPGHDLPRAVADLAVREGGGAAS